MGASLEASARQRPPYRFVHPGDHQRETTARSQLAEPVEADHGGRIDSGDTPEVDDQKAHGVGQAILDILAEPVGRAEEDKPLQAHDQDGVAVQTKAFAALLRNLEGTLIVLAGEDMADAVEAPVLDYKEDGRRDEANEDAGREADKDDDQKDQDDDQILPELQAARGQREPLEGHRRANPDEEAAEKRRRNEVEDKFAEKENAAGDGGYDDADQPVGGAEMRGEKAQRHRRITWDAAARSCREILEAYRTELPVEVDVPAGVELDPCGIHEKRHHRDDDDAW